MTDIEIIKVPIDDENHIVPPVEFKKMPILYLELIENKLKIKQNLINKPYEPPTQKSTMEEVTDKHESDTPVPERHDRAERHDKQIDSDEEVDLELIKLKELAEPIEIKEPKSLKELDLDSYQDDEDIKDTKKESPLRQSRKRIEKDIKDEPRKEPKREPKRDESRKKEREEREPSRRDESRKKESRNDKSIEDEDTFPPPLSIAELQKKHPHEPIMKKEMSFPQQDDEETIKKKNEVFFHYQVLKRMHPSAPIPEFTMYSDPVVMSQKYEMIAKKLSLDSSVESWKRYMIIFVMGLEVVLGKLAFDMEGFAQQQLVQMHTYDSLLVEIAEKSYTPKGTSKWPVEMRLLGLLTINTVLFIICKMIQKKTGANLLSTINNITNGGERQMRSPPEKID